MKVLVDANILLDVIMQRSPFFKPAAGVWELAETKRIDAVVAAISFTTIHYIVRHYTGQAAADTGVRVAFRVFPVATVDGTTIADTIQSGNPDFEDAVQIACGRHAGATHVVTRDPSGFANAGLVVLSPEDLLKLCAEESHES